MIEATLDDPRQILAAQLNKAKGEAVAQMKAEGIEYDERMELLEEVTLPEAAGGAARRRVRGLRAHQPVGGRRAPVAEVRRPRDVGAGVHLPGVRQHLRADPRPRARCCATCPTRSRRCGPACPAAARTEEVTDLVEWLGELVRQVDSSLLDEWEQLTSPDQPLDVPVAVPARPRPLTGNERAFTAMVRNALFRRVELFARRRWYDLGELDARLRAGTPTGGRRSCGPTSPSTTSCSTGADARGPALLIWDKSEPGVWRVRQILDDPDGDHDWGFDVEVDLEASDEEGAAVLRLVDAGRKD